LLSLHPAVTFDGRTQLVQNGPLQGLVFSSKEKKVKRLCPEAIALVKRLNDVHMNTLLWHELQAWRSDTEKSDWEEHRVYVQGGVDKTVRLAGDSHGLVENTVKVIKDWLVCGAPRPVSECERMDDTDALAACDVTSPDVACKVLDLTCYPEACAVALKNELEAQRARNEEERKRREEDEERRRAAAQGLGLSSVVAATARFRRWHLASGAGILAVIMLLLLLRWSRLPVWMRRLLALWFRRWRRSA
jgi:hypothetical protein